MAVVASSAAPCRHSITAPPLHLSSLPWHRGNQTLTIPSSYHLKRSQMRVSFRLARAQTKALDESDTYKPGPFDGVLLSLFRRKMVEEVGWDSTKPGYDGLVEVSRHLLAMHKNKSETEKATVRILTSLFPPFLLPLFRLIVSPLFGGKPAAMLTARVTQATCEWLMGRCSINSIDLPDGSSMESGVFVERCKYLEESKCAGICIHTCKLPTQTFMEKYMGIPLTMEPNFQDFSCQFKFGVEALSIKDDATLQTSCLEHCPTMAALAHSRVPQSQQCPQVASR